MSNAALLTRPTTDRAFERMYRRHVHDVYRYVLAVLRNPADAEDATQATFLSAYRAFQRGDRPELPRNWLLKIAHNECRQRFRMLARRPKEVVWDERVSAPPIDETIPTAVEIKQALGALSFNQRSALVMRELEGRSYREIGEILDLSVSAIETLIFRARRALREQLEGGLTCGDAEATLSKRLDGSLAPAEQRLLRAHLRECSDCAVIERKQRAQRAALKRLGVVQLPPSLAGFFGGGAGTVGSVVAGTGIAAKAAAVVAVGVLAGGVGHQAVEAVAASESPRTPLPALRQLPVSYPALHGASSTVWTARGIAEAKESAAGTRDAESLRIAVRNVFGRPRTSAPPSASGEPGGGSIPAADQLAGATPQAPVSTPAAVNGAVEVAREVAKIVPVPKPPTVETPPVSTPQPLPPLPLPPPPPLPLPPPPPLPGIGG